MVREDTTAKIFLAAVIVLGMTICSLTGHSESFDKPVRETVISLGRSRYLMANNPSRIQLSCFYYQKFMVKQLNNPGLKGVRWVTVTPVINNDAPPCRLAHASTERFMATAWWGFEGIKRSLLFLHAADGDGNGGMPFRILDLETGKKLFEDSTEWKSDLAFLHNRDGTISLKYSRVVGGACSIPKDGASCWGKYKRLYGLALATAPKCTGYRNEGDKEWVAGDPGTPPEEISTPSAIAYPVELKLFPRPSIRVIPGPVRCTPVE